MTLLLKAFACRISTVHEKAMLAIGALAYACGEQFEKYMPEFCKYLEMGLHNFEEYQVCSISVGVVGDVCRAMDEKVLPYCDGIMTLLLKDLSSGELHRSVKPAIFSCFGDIALAIGAEFQKYLPYAISMLQTASGICAQLDANDEELLDYGNQLRRSIFEAYSGLLQGFKNANSDLMAPHASHLLQFIDVVVKDVNRDEAVLKAVVAVLGDVADTVGKSIKPLLIERQTEYGALLNEWIESGDEGLKETARWTHGMLCRAVLP